MKTEFFFWTTTAAVLVPCMGFSAEKAKNEKPNIVFILADDLGYGDLSCYGQERFATPNIDSLARRGMRFTQCYSGTTVSAPSRSCLLTGTHSGHTPIRGNLSVKPEGQYPLPAGTRTIFHLFRDAGYATGAFGKWGLGTIGSPGDPAAQGVDEFFGYNCQGLAHNYYPDHLWDNDRRVDLPQNADGACGVYSQDTIHARAVRFLERNRKQPFVLFYPTTLPHAELIVPEDSIIRKFRGQYPETPYRGVDAGPGFRKGAYGSQTHPHAAFAAMVYRLDVYVGQLVAKLRELGLYDNTLIIFASDNGPHKEGGADPDFFDGNGIYRGYKRDLYEGGIRVPMLVAWPGHVGEGSETNFMCSFWDLMPTFGEILGRAEGPDGISLLPLLEGREGQQEHDYLYFEFMEQGGKQAVRRGPWKLIHRNIRNPRPVWELYNLDDDPSETQNVVSQHPELVTQLQRLMCEAHTESPVWELFGKDTTR